MIKDLQIPMAAARAAANKTQAEVAKAMGVSNKTIMNWETGKVRPRIAQLKMYCEICDNFDPDNILLP